MEPYALGLLKRMHNRKLLLGGTNQALLLCPAPHESRDLPRKHTMESSCGGPRDYTKTTECVDSKAALLALGWRDKLFGIIYGIDDMHALCKAYSSEYPSFSEKMDKLLHN